MRGKRKDRTHGAILQTFRALGCDVLDVSDAPNLGCDLVVWCPDGRSYAVECKDGAKSPSQRKLTDSEARLALLMPARFRIVGSTDEALWLAKPSLRPATTRKGASPTPESSGVLIAPPRASCGETT